METRDTPASFLDMASSPTEVHPSSMLEPMEPQDQGDPLLPLLQLKSWMKFLFLPFIPTAIHELCHKTNARKHCNTRDQYLHEYPNRTQILGPLDEL